MSARRGAARRGVRRPCPDMSGPRPTCHTRSSRPFELWGSRPLTLPSPFGRGCAWVLARHELPMPLPGRGPHLCPVVPPPSSWFSSCLPVRSDVGRSGLAGACQWLVPTPAPRSHKETRKFGNQELLSHGRAPRRRRPRPRLHGAMAHPPPSGTPSNSFPRPPGEGTRALALPARCPSHGAAATLTASNQPHRRSAAHALRSRRVPLRSLRLVRSTGVLARMSAIRFRSTAGCSPAPASSTPPGASTSRRPGWTWTSCSASAPGPRR
jgi:hypothetical protein